MSNWIRRNPLLLPIALLVAFMLIKGLFKKILPEDGSSALPSKDFFTSFWMSTPLGPFWEGIFGIGSSWMLWIVVIAAVVIVWRKIISRHDVTKSGQHVPLIDQILVLAIILIGGSVILAITWIVLSLFGLDDGIEAMVSGSEGRKGGVVAECTTNETSLDFRFDSGARDVIICQGGEQFYLLPTHGYNLEFEISPRFLRENGHLFKNRDLSDFVKIEKPGTYLESIEESYKLSPISGIENFSVSAFDRSGLDKIVVTVRAVKEGSVINSQEVKSELALKDTSKAVSDSNVENCSDEFAKLKDCKRVTFKAGSRYKRVAKPYMCIAYNPDDIVIMQPMGNEVYNFKSKITEATVNFFDLAIGERHGDFKCGG